MVAKIPEGPDTGPPSVICAGLWRMGTASMAAAFNDLGLRPHHALDISYWPEQWVQFEKAADATWPTHPSSARAPFTREDWDVIYGKFGAVTEIGAAFAEQLIAAYPEAKVVIVRRDFDKWWPSFRAAVLDPIFSYQGTFMLHVVLPILGIRSMAAMRKILLGFFEASRHSDVEKNARRVVDAYYERLDELVPAERKLKYSLGQGWEPLCAFLDLPIPNTEFPFVNEAEVFKAWQEQETARFNGLALQKIKSWLPWS